MVKAPVDAELAPIAVPSIAPELRSTSPLAARVVKAPVDAELAPIGPVIPENVPAAAEFAPITVPSTAPPSTSILLISTSPVPLGVIAMFPLEPSVIVMDPVVEFPV